MSKENIVAIVDDDHIYRFTIKKNIEALKIPVKTLIFTHGKEALDFILENLESVEKLPDTILLDVNMPVMDGFEFMEKFKKLKPEIKNGMKIFMISSSINPTDINKAKTNLEITDYISKPINMVKLQRIFPIKDNTDAS